MAEINAKVGDKYWYVYESGFGSYGEIYEGPVKVEKINSKTVSFTDPHGKKRLARPCQFKDGTFEVDGTGGTYKLSTMLVPVNEKSNEKAARSRAIRKTESLWFKFRTASAAEILDRLGIGLIEEMIRKLETPPLARDEPE